MRGGDTAPSPRSARLLHAVLLGALLGVMSACGSVSGTTRQPSSLQDEVRVSGDFGEKPAITVAAPLEVSSSSSWTAVRGSGDKVGPDSTTILQLTMADARTGKTVISTLDKGQRPLEAGLTDQLFPSLIQALSGARAGSRLVVASTASDTYGDQGAPQLGIKAGDAVVLVADVLSTDPTSVLSGPQGTSTPAARAPRVVEGSSGPTGFETTGLAKPAKAEVFTLRRGTGRAIAGPRRIVANYLGAVWGASTPFDSSYTKEPAKFSIGIGAVVPCWDKGLSGVRAGSRVLLVCPPATAYGTTAKPGIPAGSTLVFVLDVLGVG